MTLQGSHTAAPGKVLAAGEQDIPRPGPDVRVYAANEGHAGLSSGDLAELYKFHLEFL